MVAKAICHHSLLWRLSFYTFEISLRGPEAKDDTRAGLGGRSQGARSSGFRFGARCLPLTLPLLGTKGSGLGVRGSGLGVLLS